MWFEKLAGFAERSPDQVRANLYIEGDSLVSRVNGRSWRHGRLETPSLGDLRDRVQKGKPQSARLLLREVVADVQSLHANATNSGATFQVASQFNLLEMASQNATPELGVDIYEHDHTQGPACAIAAGAGTIYRNYFAPTNGAIGQSARNQIDCLADVGLALGNENSRLWQMVNGYALPSESGLEEVATRLQACNESELDRLRAKLRVGIQWNTQVTLPGAKHLVAQVYCSALPVAYSSYPFGPWESFAQLVLDAAYEATFCAAILNSRQAGSNKLYLTQLGGGVFGNKTSWITAAIKRSLDLYKHADLDVAIVSYRPSKPHVKELVDYFEGLR